MSNIRLIQYEDVPCWYEFSWRETHGIVLRIHTDCVQHLVIPPEAPVIASTCKEFGFSGFSQMFGADIGFNNALPFLGTEEQFLVYHVPTPLVRKLGKTCTTCNGSGKDEDAFREQCLRCSGEGKDIRYDYAEAYAVSATLTLFLEQMRYPEFQTSCDRSQVMCVQTFTINSSHGGHISGVFGRNALAWMRMHGRRTIPEMVTAMRTAWERMDGGLRDFYEHSFSAYLSDENGWLCTDCPGDACGLHPSDHHLSRASDHGFEFTCHNTDTPMQQLTLLAGLAALHDLIRTP